MKNFGKKEKENKKFKNIDSSIKPKNKHKSLRAQPLPPQKLSSGNPLIFSEKKSVPGHKWNNFFLNNHQVGCRDTFKAAFIFFSIIVILFWPFFFQGKIIAPTDILLDYAPWKVLRPDHYTISNTLRSDVVDQILPAWKFFQDQIHEGTVPLWNPYMAQGQPFFPLLHFSLLFPPVLLALLFLPLAAAFSVLVVLKLLAMGFFTYLFLRKLKLGFWPAVSGGIVYMLCGFNTVWLLWPHTFVTALAPLLFLAVENLLERPNFRNAAKISFVVALMIFAGFPAVAGYFFYAVWLYALIRMYMVRAHIGKKFLKPLGLMVLGFLLGAGLCTIQLLPTLEYFRFIDIGYRAEQSMAALPLSNFQQIFFPNSNGNPVFNTWRGEVNYNETTGYIGLLPLLFLLIALISGMIKKKWLPVFFSSMTLLSLMVVFNFGPLLYLLHFLPVFNSSSSTRLLAIFGFFGAIGAAFGFEDVVSFCNNIWKKISKGMPTNFLGKIFFALLFALFITADLLFFALPQNPPTDEKFFYPVTPAIAFLQQHQKPYQRLMAFDFTFMIPGTQLYYGLNSIFSHTFYSPAHRQLIQTFSDAFVTPTAVVPSLQKTDLRSPLPFSTGVQYFIFNPSQIPFLSDVTIFDYPPVYSGPDAIIFQNNKKIEGGFLISPSAVQISDENNLTVPEEKLFQQSSHANIHVQDYRANEVSYTLQNSAQTFFITSERFYPGWKAFMDGKETRIYKVNGVLRGVLIPEGEHTLQFIYSPNSFWYGLGLSAFSLVVILAMLWLDETRYFHSRTQ